MNSWRIALSELRRITAGRMPKVALLALVLVPTLYGGMYLYANHDPYGRLNQVPAALVVEDSGTTQADGTRLDAGKDVGDELVAKNNFDWHRVTAAEAATGVKHGRYDFALTIPRDFSAALGSSADFEPRQAQLRMTTNDANSYLSTTIADKVTSSVRDAIAQKVGAEAATQFLLGLGDIRASLVKAAKGADQLSSGITTAKAGSAKLSDGAGQLQTGATTLSTGLGTLADKTATLPAQTRELADGARQVADADAKVAATGDTIATAAGHVADDYATRRTALQQALQSQGLTDAQQQQILGIYDGLGQPVRDANSKVQAGAKQLDQLASGADQVADGNEKLAANVPALVDGIEQAHTGATKLATGAGTLATGAADLDTGLGQLQTGSGQLAAGLRSGVQQIPPVNDSTRKRLADTIADPVAVDTTSQATAGSYGAGLAPFFLALAAWIGGYVLFMVVRPLSPRAMSANQTPIRVALGGWITPALIGLVQVTVLLLVVLLGVRITPANVPGTLLFMMATSLTFVAIVHALSAWFGKTGQFLGLVLMVLQLITAGGTFPWQTLPHPLYALHYALPMSYAVDGLRQLMYGGLDTLVLRDLGVLALWFVVAILLAGRAARTQRVWTVKRIKPELAL
ncbi:MAG: transporter [Nocardioidaceae bacterium]|nr:transporter [Nocardioidaceae bacterium]